MLVRRFFKRENRERSDEQNGAADGIDFHYGKIGNQKPQAAAYTAQAIDNEHNSFLAETQISKAMRHVVLARGGEGQETAPGTRNDDQGGVENRYAENQDWEKQVGRKMWRDGSQFQTEGRHEEAEQHRAAVPHEDSRWSEIPAQKTESRAHTGGRKCANHQLTIDPCRDREKCRSHSSQASTEAVHVVENAERCCNADNPEYGEGEVERGTQIAAN